MKRLAALFYLAFEFIVMIAMAFGIMGALSLVMGLPLMLFWNWLMPELFGLKMIQFWQAAGIYFLSGLLFRSDIKFNASK